MSVGHGCTRLKMKASPESLRSVRHRLGVRFGDLRYSSSA
jgi:hypothetical protein